MNHIWGLVLQVWRALERLETALLACWIALAGVVWAFLSLGSEMREGELSTFDLWVLTALRKPLQPHSALGPHWLVEAMRDVTALGGVVILALVTIIAIIVLLAHRRRAQAMLLAVYVPLAQLSSELFKNIYDRPRPSFAVYGDLPTSMSFPSGHSTAATATYFLLAVVASGLETKRPMKVFWFAIAALLALAVGMSRIYLGVHWPSDVLAGWSLGAAWAFIASVQGLGRMYRPGP